jgi:hypothetical protein
VNDISREVGGVLGVAVVGSVFVSLYTPKLIERFTALPGLVEALPPGAYDAAQDSVGAAYSVAQQSPGEAQSAVLSAVSDSFMHGFSTACLVTAGMAFVGALCALKFLPARADVQEV